MSHTFNYQQVVEDVRTTLQNAFGPNAAIRTEEGWHGRVHVKIVSNAFDGTVIRKGLNQLYAL